MLALALALALEVLVALTFAGPFRRVPLDLNLKLSFPSRTTNSLGTSRVLEVYARVLYDQRLYDLVKVAGVPDAGLNQRALCFSEPARSSRMSARWPSLSWPESACVLFCLGMRGQAACPRDGLRSSR